MPLECVPGLILGYRTKIALKFQCVLNLEEKRNVLLSSIIHSVNWTFLPLLLFKQIKLISFQHEVHSLQVLRLNRERITKELWNCKT